MPTEAEARNLAGWAAEFGPGGSFWRGRKDAHLAVRQIEFGNETSYSHQYGDSWADQSYKDRARLYATRFAQARRGRRHRPSGRPARPGRRRRDRLLRLGRQHVRRRPQPRSTRRRLGGPPVRAAGHLGAQAAPARPQTAANGAPGNIPIDITEWGISTNNGIALDDNYGWPVNLTFLQAGLALKTSVLGMRLEPRCRVAPAPVHALLGVRPERVAGPERPRAVLRSAERRPR